MTVDCILYASKVATHADSLIAEAVVKGITGFDRELAWEAVWKDATTAPKDDGSVRSVLGPLER